MPRRHWFPTNTDATGNWVSPWLPSPSKSTWILYRISNSLRSPRIFIDETFVAHTMDFSSLKDQVSNLTLYDIKAGVRKVQNGKVSTPSKWRGMDMRNPKQMGWCKEWNMTDDFPIKLVQLLWIIRKWRPRFVTVVVVWMLLLHILSSRNE